MEPRHPKPAGVGGNSGRSSNLTTQSSSANAPGVYEKGTKPGEKPMKPISGHISPSQVIDARIDAQQKKRTGRGILNAIRAREQQKLQPRPTTQDVMASVLDDLANLLEEPGKGVTFSPGDTVWGRIKKLHQAGYTKHFAKKAAGKAGSLALGLGSAVANGLAIHYATQATLAAAEAARKKLQRNHDDGEDETEKTEAVYILYQLMEDLEARGV